MIPKIIHYCWFGKGAKPLLVKNCIKSWEKYCPDYIIIEWNELNFDFSCHQYPKFAYEHKMWAFVSDYARLKIIYDNGGFYLDTDVELLSNIDFLASDKFFCGFELPKALNTGIGFGAEKNATIVQNMMEEYNNVDFIDINGILNLTPCTIYNTNALIKEGVILNNTLQRTENYTIYPTDYFSPKSYETGIIKTTTNTVSIHHFTSSWENEKSLNKKQRQHKIANILGHRYGTKIILMLDLFEVARKKGLIGTLRGVYRQIRTLVKSKIK